MLPFLFPGPAEIQDNLQLPDGDPRLKRSPHGHFKGCFFCGHGGGGYYPPPHYVQPVYEKTIYVQPVYVKPAVYAQPVYSKPYHGSGCSTCGQWGGGGGSYSYSQSSASSSSWGYGWVYTLQRKWRVRYIKILVGKSQWMEITWKDNIRMDFTKIQIQPAKQRGNISFRHQSTSSLAVTSTGNPSVRTFVYITALQGQYKITLSLKHLQWFRLQNTTSQWRWKYRYHLVYAS